MAKVAMFGTGMMGSGMAERMLKGGDQVQVWNRTIEKARPLEALGARAIAEPVAAAQDVERIHISLGDDASVDSLFDKILEKVPKGTIVIDHTTVTPKGTLERVARAEQAGVEFLHAPVFMSPQATRDGGGVIVASGPQARFKKVEDALKKMTGEVWYVGERPDKAAAMKLFGNELLFFIVAGLADVYALAKSVGIEPREAHELFSHFKPAVSIEMRGKNMANGNFDSSFDLAMARKDVRLMLETAAEGGVKLEILPTIAKRMDELIAQGKGGADVGVLAEDSMKTPAGAVK